MDTSRRNFIRGATFSGMPFILPAHIWAAETQPNSRPTIGFIGMGKQARSLLENFLNQDVQVLAVCDVDTNRRENAKETVDQFYAKAPEKGAKGCKAYNDFRELIARPDIDMVCIATPDHWHAVQIMAALRAGKDVYCEKPLTHNVHESVEIMKAVKETGRVLQTGSMQRSSKEFRVACELVRNGCIGKVQRVECSFGGPPKPYALKEEAMEPGLDWDLWLGPAQKCVYNPALCPRGVHNQYPAWRSYREFGGGGVTDWGAHHLDIAQWGLGMDEAGPVEVRPPEQADANIGGVLVYADGVTVIHKPGFGIDFFGTEGEVQVTRGKFTFTRNGEPIAKFTKSEDGSSCEAQVVKAERAFLKDAKIKLYASKGHIPDFLNCVKSRQKPIANEQVGGRTAICCNLLNQVYYNRKRIRWDPIALKLVEGDPKWLTREYRAPWNV